MLSVTGVVVSPGYYSSETHRYRSSITVQPHTSTNPQDIEPRTLYLTYDIEQQYSVRRHNFFNRRPIVIMIGPWPGRRLIAALY